MNWHFAAFLVFNSAASNAAGVKAIQTSKPWPECAKIDRDLDSTMKSQKFSLGTLKLIFSIYNSKKNCDDGAYAEGFSEIVCRSLSRDFKASLEALEKDLDMKKFVMKHIDATADQFDLEKIKGNAAMSCQIKTKSLCEEIGKLATRAIEQIKDDDLLDKKR